MNIKRILPIEINYKIKHFWESFSSYIPDCGEDVLNSARRVFFLDAPAYGNMGDQAIAYAVEKYISDVLPNYDLIEVTEDKLVASMKWLKKTIRENDIICLTGGGNMGVTYQRYEAVRRLVLKTFPHNSIVVFPQTFDYGTDRYSRRELNRAKKVYGSVNQLTLCARDYESYKIMCECFSNSRVLFVPDIVLYLDYRNCFKKTERVGICFRRDIERVLTEEKRMEIEARFPNSEQLSTIASEGLPITQANRQMILERKLEEFGTKKLILTDRLHGMLFAFITDTPCFVFPNSNGKNERVSRYLTSLGRVGFGQEVEENIMLRENRYEKVLPMFDELEKTIKSYMNNE